MAELRGRVAGRQETQQAKEPTVEDVLAAYQAGKITEADKDKYVYAIAVRDAERRAVTKTKEETQQQTAATRTQLGIQAYVQNIPALQDRNSREWQELSAEYRDLLASGQPDSPATQLVALRATFGRIERLQARRQPDGTREASTFAERPASTGPAPKKPDTLVGADGKPIPPEQIAWWKSQGYSAAEMAAEAKFYRSRGSRVRQLA
jgi:hypothetical protein